jgi:hypothetical protein
MKPKRNNQSKRSAPLELQDAIAPYRADPPPMIRTQIYLSRAEYDFLQKEAQHSELPMAALIRSFIDERMRVPEEAWSDNPLLQPPVKDSTWKGRTDGAVNHDHYVYGTPKKWMKRRGKWVETPPLPEDYYTNPASRRAYDEMVNQSK